MAIVTTTTTTVSELEAKLLDVNVEIDRSFASIGDTFARIAAIRSEMEQNDQQTDHLLDRL